MVISRTKKIIGAASITVLGLTLAIIGNGLTSGMFKATRGADDPYTLVLDSKNRVSSNGDHVATSNNGGQVTFTYTNVSNSTGSYHTILNEGGTIVNKDIIHSITRFNATFTGTLQARIAYTTSTWGEYFNLASGQDFDLGSNPYFFEIKAVTSVTLTSATYGYSCTVNPDAEEQDTEGSYDITFKANGSDNSTALSNSTQAMAEVTSGSDYISSFSSITKVYAGSEGLKLGASSGTCSITINFDSSEVIYDITTITVTSAQYGSDTGKLKFFINGSTSYTQITPSAGGSITVGGSLESLTISTTTKRAYLCGLSLNYGGKTEPGAPENPDPVEIGFTASDSHKDTYTTNSVFTTDNDLQVAVIYSNNSQNTTQEYTYTIKDSVGATINPSQKFPAIGVYTLTVSYKSFVPVEITLNVGEYIFIESIAAASDKVTFTTADILNDYLGSNVRANVTYSDGSNSNINYVDFADNNLGLKLLNPKGITYDGSNPFGTAGTWTIKVYRLDDDAIYSNISITVNAIPVQTITLSESTYTLYPEGTLQLVATVNPDYATNTDVVWSSNNESVATVEDGLVTAVAVGGATITATAADGSNVYGSCVITVNAVPPEPTYTLVTSISQVSNGDLVVVKTEDGLGVTGWNGTKDATVSETSSDWKQFVVGNASSSGWTLYDSAASKYIATPGGNEFKYSTSGGTCYVGDDGELMCSSRYLAVNGTNYRFYLTSQSYDAFYVYLYGSGTPVTPVYPTAITLTGDGALSIGGTSQLSVGYTPSDTNVKNVTYTSSNESVATVSNTGLVTGVAVGSATITATAEAESGTITATKNVTVSPISVTGVSLDSNSASVKVGKTVTLVATVAPTNATNKSVSWSSSDTAVATVSNNGVVTGVAAGSATITVTTADGNKTAQCIVTVTASSGIEEYSITYTDLPTTYQTGSTVYTASSGIKFQAYNCANYSGKMQFKASAGYIQTTESLDLYSIEINDRESNTLTVYGSNTAGSFSTQITGTNDVYDLQGYTYFKIARTSSGAAYCSSVTVTTGIPTPTDPTDIILDPSSCEIAAGGSKTIGVSYVPSNANQNKDITWTSSNSSVATVDSTGKITVSSSASAGQSATITAKLTNIPSISKTVAVTVVEQQKDDHTVLIYMCGADLESENQLATGDIQEILKVNGQPDDVNIVIETGGAKSWASTYGISSTYLERWHVENKSLVRDETLPEYASMGLSSTLQSFIEYGLNNYPAERTGLIFWNHGGGMRGVCYDEKKNDDVLKNSEIRSAISGALSNCNITDKLEWVGYDACLMAVQDIAETNSAYFNYMIASEESEAGYGWDYDNWVDDLYAKKSTTTILKAIVDSFISDNGGASSSSGDQTLSYLDLSYAAAYKTAWENLAAQLNSVVTSSNKSSFNSAITGNVKHYADSDYDYFCTFDAWDFVDKLANNSAFSSFRVDASYITAVKNAHANLVAYNLAQKGAGVSKGLCMYWPNSSQYSDVSTYYTTSETNFTTWRNFCVNKGTHA